jgi:hypothetical protein
MPAGDARRVWFPEMLEELQHMWPSSVSWEELGDFCHRVTEKRKQICDSRGIKSPLVRCPACGVVARSGHPEVSIRSALFALRGTGTVGEAERKALDRSWKNYEKNRRLDPYGRKLETSENTMGKESKQCCRFSADDRASLRG